VLLALFAALPLPAFGGGQSQTQSPSRADESAIRSYSLTMSKFEAWVAATAATQRALEALPEGEARAVRIGADGSIDRVAGIYDRIPSLRSAVRDHGLTTREFTVFGLALIQALTVNAALRYNPNGAKPDQVNPANLKFVEANRAVIEERMRSMGRR